MTRRALGLKWSLLAALGVIPIACGDSGDEEDPQGTAGTSGTPAQAGTGNQAGSASHAGDASGGGGADSRGGAGGGGNTNNRSCTSPTVDETTGLIRCQEGYLHRPEATACPSSSGGGGGAGGTGGAGQRAEAMAECYDAQSYGGGTDHCDTCETDADCGDQGFCICKGELGGVCSPSNCKTDADCGDGFLCASYRQGCGPSGFACQRPDDQCSSDQDCGGSSCGFSPGESSFRACDNTVCGRPFLVEDSARVAPAIANRDWSSEVASPRLEHLTLAERAELAAHWTHMGQMEHASIAAFARFSMQLLQLGAPPELIEACTQALADETAHTRLCFQLASAYSGRSIGPGPLDMAGCLTVTSLVDVVDLVIAEGCFGETNAALEALDAADAASDPVIAAAYTQIAGDEQRHAELAFRFVRWALERDGRSVAARIEAALETPTNTACHAVALACLRALLDVQSRRIACEHSPFTGQDDAFIYQIHVWGSSGAAVAIIK